jgi:hypothetical protein
VEDIVLAAAINRVVAVTAVDRVDPGSGQHRVVARAGVDCVGTVTTGDRIISVAAGQAVIVGTAVDRIVSNPAFDRIRAEQPRDVVVAAVAAQQVGDVVAENGIVADAAGGVFDQRARVVVVLQCVVDVALGEAPAAVRRSVRVHATIQVGKLGSARHRPFAGPQVDVDAAGAVRVAVVRHVVGVVAEAVPDGQEHAIGARPLSVNELRHVVDRHGSGGLVPGVLGVVGVGAEVCAVHVLQGGDVEHHERLRVAPLLRDQ